ncbi:MAG: hypothetical protein Q9201_000864 [Fulgogasparrea decipioides]
MDGPAEQLQSELQATIPPSSSLIIPRIRQYILFLFRPLFAAAATSSRALLRTFPTTKRLILYDAVALIFLAPVLPFIGLLLLPFILMFLVVGWLVPADRSALGVTGKGCRRLITFVVAAAGIVYLSYIVNRGFTGWKDNLTDQILLHYKDNLRQGFERAEQRLTYLENRGPPSAPKNCQPSFCRNTLSFLNYPNHYAVLGFSPPIYVGDGRRPTEAEIEKSYRILSRPYHPDKGSLHHLSKASSQLISIIYEEARATLLDPKKREFWEEKWLNGAMRGINDIWANEVSHEYGIMVRLYQIFKEQDRVSAWKKEIAKRQPLLEAELKDMEADEAGIKKGEKREDEEHGLLEIVELLLKWYWWWARNVWRWVGGSIAPMWKQSVGWGFVVDKFLGRFWTSLWVD